ncbi:MAG TPA: biopolymer transporter ExbD [Microscillaceae bacterium]|nr:biopolymer transporter ExbD [Microscillaceae bacterium]
MNLKSKNQISTTFSLASLTDIIFLLLIFFMLTSSFVTPSAVPVELPSTKVSKSLIAKQLEITITKELEYYINDEAVKLEEIEAVLKQKLEKVDAPKVVLNIDKTVAVEYLVKVAAIANKLGAKLAIATEAETVE